MQACERTVSFPLENGAEMRFENREQRVILLEYLSRLPEVLLRVTHKSLVRGIAELNEYPCCAFMLELVEGSHFFLLFPLHPFCGFGCTSYLSSGEPQFYIEEQVGEQHVVFHRCHFYPLHASEIRTFGIAFIPRITVYVSGIYSRVQKAFLEVAVLINGTFVRHWRNLFETVHTVGEQFHDFPFHNCKCGKDLFESLRVQWFIIWLERGMG